MPLRMRGRRSGQSLGRHAKRHAARDAARALSARRWAASPATAATRSRSRRSSTSATRFAPGPERTFGQFLSSFLVSHPVPPDVTSRAGARHARADAAGQAAQAVPADAVPARLRRPRVAFHDARPAQAHVREELSGVGGDVRAQRRGDLGKGTGAAPVLHYLRAVSTGPFAPLVLRPPRWATACTSASRIAPAAFSARRHRANQ